MVAPPSEPGGFQVTSPVLLLYVIDEINVGLDAFSPGIEGTK